MVLSGDDSVAEGLTMGVIMGNYNVTAMLVLVGLVYLQKPGATIVKPSRSQALFTILTFRSSSGSCVYWYPDLYRLSAHQE